MKEGKVKGAEEVKVTPGSWIQSPLFQNDNAKLVLLGDSILDNFFWLKDPLSPLTVQLNRLCLESKLDLQIVNLAVDQHSTFDLAKRNPTDNPWRIYKRAKETLRDRFHFFEMESSGFSATEPLYMEWSDGCLYAFETLKLLKNVKWVVLSIGGNDVYLRRNVSESLMRSLRPRYKRLRHKVAQDFEQRYMAILDQIQKAAPNSQTLAIVPYHPAASFSILGLQKGVPWAFSTTLQSFDQLYGTGDWKKKNLFGVGFSGVEPSNQGSFLIAQLIVAVVKAPTRKTSSVLFKKGSEKLLWKKNNHEFRLYYKFGKK